MKKQKKEKFEFPIATAFIAGAILLAYLAFSSFIFFPDEKFVNGFALSQFSLQNIIFYAFVHSGYSHLIVNILTIIIAGLILEPFIGKKQIIALFFGAVVVCGIVFVLINPNTALIGASGGGFALLTAAIIAKPKKTLISILIVLAASALFTYGAGVIIAQKEQINIAQIKNLEVQKNIAIENNDNAGAQKAQNEINSRTNEIESIKKGIEFDSKAQLNFEIHIIAAIFGALYMFLFHRKIVNSTTKALFSYKYT